ncbi:MAG: histidine phosphatase family protein [Burkholderiales bacterium RIFCSPHIGHO2_01_FULL_63_240]|jgi:phosphohistidine phosphatase|nr:MAG: histidine phosphatase family protein [Burkholderiales bacterium RIFCSPHIGHO2_01_FULL_63_240]
MDLILWRHAQAVMLEDEGGTAAFDLARDLARPLTPKGERQAARMAEWLNQRLPDTTRILVSPARRTQQTAEALGRRFRTVDAINPLASVDDVLAAARWPDAREPVLIVGHQPTLGLLASRLLTGQDQPWSVRKGAAWWLRSREREGGEQVVLHAVVPPDLA